MYFNSDILIIPSQAASAEVAGVAVVVVVRCAVVVVLAMLIKVLSTVDDLKFDSVVVSVVVSSNNCRTRLDTPINGSLVIKKPGQEFL